MDQKMMIMLIIGVCVCVCISISIGVGIYFSTKTTTSESEEIEEDDTDTPAAGTPAAGTPAAGTPAATLLFKKSLETNKYGGQGGGPGVLLCPQGAFINEVYGGSGYVIDRIGIKCSDGKILNPLGGSGGRPFSIKSQNGFNKMNVKTGDLVDNIELYFNNEKIGSAGGAGGVGGPHLLDCNDGKLMGLNLRSAALVDNIGVICGKEQ